MIKPLKHFWICRGLYDLTRFESEYIWYNLSEAFHRALGVCALSLLFREVTPAITTAARRWDTIAAATAPTTTKIKSNTMTMGWSGEVQMYIKCACHHSVEWKNIYESRLERERESKFIINGIVIILSRIQMTKDGKVIFLWYFLYCYDIDSNAPKEGYYKKRINKKWFFIKKYESFIFITIILLYLLWKSSWGGFSVFLRFLLYRPCKLGFVGRFTLKALGMGSISRTRLPHVHWKLESFRLLDILLTWVFGSFVRLCLDSTKMNLVLWLGSPKFWWKSQKHWKPTSTRLSKQKKNGNRRKCKSREPLFSTNPSLVALNRWKQSILYQVPKCKWC